MNSCEYWFIEDNEVVRCGRTPTKEVMINGQRMKLCGQHSAQEVVKELWQKDMIFRYDLKKIFEAVKK